MKNIKIFLLFAAVAVMTAFSSCSTELKLASRFVRNSSQVKAAVFFPEEAQVSLVQNEEGNYTHVLDTLDQNAFLDIMYSAYADELSHFGIEVVVPEDIDAVVTDSTYWMVLVSKVEIQGLFTPYVDYLFDLTEEYEFPFSLNTVNVASWFDINDGEWHPTQYYEYNLREDFSSYVSTKGKEGPQYHYDITPLRTSDIYDFAVFLGKRCAACTHSYMMNRYVSKEMAKTDSEPRFMIGWDPEEETFYIQEEGFIEVR